MPFPFKTFPRCGTKDGYEDTSGDVTLRAIAVVTNALVPTDAVLVKGYQSVTLKFPYVKGDETTIDIYAEGSSDDGVTWTPLGRFGTTSGGKTPLRKDIFTLAPGDYGANDRAGTPPLACWGYALVRCQIIGTGGTPTGQVGVVVSGWAR